MVGDAAGQVKPTTGGGIYYGLLCAEIAADTLNGALAGNDLSAENLAEYERRWKKKLGRELRVGYWARKLYERLSDGQIDRI
ncbi:MAG: NAD(P)/FAD-dependent oxidoreductase, partial [Thermoplasmata archaeon]